MIIHQMLYGLMVLMKFQIKKRILLVLYNRYWDSPDFLSWLYSSSPVKNTIVTNSRWGDTVSGDYLTGNDRYTPTDTVGEKYECCYTMTKDCWSYDKTKTLSDFYSSKQLIMQLANIVATGGNFLLNVGPTADGRITPEYEERLNDIGDWMNINSESIYSTIPYKTPFENNKQISYTVSKKDPSVLYAIFFTWPDSNTNLLKLKTPKATDNTEITLLGDKKSTKFTFEQKEDGLEIKFPFYTLNELPNPYGWVLKLKNTN